MCWARKCCGVLALDLGCIIIGIVTLVTTMFLSVTAIVLLVLDNRDKIVFGFSKTITNIEKVFNIEIARTAIICLLVALLIVGIFGVTASLALMRGIQKNNPSFVLFFFVYGIVLSILIQLACLMELLHNHWILATVQISVSLIFIHCLVVIHTAYETMQRGKQFGTNPHQVFDDESLIPNDE